MERDLLVCDPQVLTLEGYSLGHGIGVHIGALVLPGKMEAMVLDGHRLLGLPAIPTFGSSRQWGLGPEGSRSLPGPFSLFATWSFPAQQQEGKLWPLGLNRRWKWEPRSYQIWFTDHSMSREYVSFSLFLLSPSLLA